MSAIIMQYRTIRAGLLKEFQCLKRALTGNRFFDRRNEAPVLF